jgi:hypothetical protein
MTLTPSNAYARLVRRFKSIKPFTDHYQGDYEWPLVQSPLTSAACSAMPGRPLVSVFLPLLNVPFISLDNLSKSATLDAEVVFCHCPLLGDAPRELRYWPMLILVFKFFPSNNVYRLCCVYSLYDFLAKMDCS